MLDTSKKTAQHVEVTDLQCSFDDNNFLVSDFDKFFFDELRFCFEYFIDLFVERNGK